MILSFGIVFVILSKYGFPVIIKAVEQRKEYIDRSLESARQANEQLADIQAEGEKILAEKEQIISEARQKASAEAHMQLEEATRRIREEKDKAIREVRTEIADLSVAIAEKVMKEEISRTDEQEKIINGLLDNVSFSKS